MGDIKQFEVVQLKDIRIESGFWGARQATNRTSTIPSIYHQLQITGRIDAWHLDWQPGQPKPHIFWDSDAGKWIEAVGYSLASHADSHLEQQADELIALVEKAQQPDRYLNIFFSSGHPQNRRRNLRDWQHMYDPVDLMERA